jgi:SAM-dependent methyltransferase
MPSSLKYLFSPVFYPMKLYNELAEYYYAIENDNRNTGNDIRMISNMLKGRNKPSLLDIGCGSGEHINELAKLNIDCTGIDSSSSMLKIARMRFPNSGNFIRKDMQDFNFNEKFDIAISLFGSFNYMIEDSDINAVFKNTWNSIKSGGIGLFEIWNAIPITAIREKPLALVSRINYNNTIITRERGFRLLEDQNKTIVEVNYNYSLPNNKILEDQHIMRAFTRTEIEYHLENNGFNVIDFYSNSSMEAFNDMSNKIIVHFKK